MNAVLAAPREPRRPRVLLLHASASSPRQWDRLRDSLADAFDAFAMDLLTHEVRRAGPRFSLVEEARALLPVLAQEGGAHVIGHSYGGAVALKLAAVAPAFVRSVVAYEPVVFRWVMEDGAGAPLVAEAASVASHVREAVERGEFAQGAAPFIDFWSGAGAWASMAPPRREAILPRLPSLPRHFEALFSEPMRWVDVARLDVPMLFLSGTATVPVARRNAELLRRWFPRARHEAIPGAGHMGPITHAAAVNPVAAGFVRDLEEAAVSSGP